MFIFNSMRQEKGLCAIVALRPFIQSVAAIGFTTTLACASGVTPTNISLLDNGAPTISVSGVFKSNIGMNSVTLGEKTFQLKGADFHSPIAVKLFAQSNKDAQKFDAVADSAIGADHGAFQFALSQDINQVPGMTALDVTQSSDFGRMIAPTGNRATRTQVFLSLPERDNNPLADDKTPELILMGAVPNGTIQITPILAGNAEIPESLIFGRTLEFNPTDMAKGMTGLSIIPQSASSPQRMCVVGLDLSGDLKVEANDKVVGYQLECPAGSNTAIKLMSVGAQESIVYASDAPSLDMIALGSINDSENSSYVIYAQAAAPISSNVFSPSMSPFAIEPEVLGDDATLISQIIGPIFNRPQNGVEGTLPEPGYNLPSTNTSPMQSYDDGGGSSLPPGNYVPPPPGIPTPGAIALLGMAAGFMARRRNTRTQG